MKHYFLAITLFFSGFLFSQTSYNDSIKLNEVIVTGSKTEISRKIVPLSVSQISKTNIENSGQMNILTALNQFAPGIFVTERNIFGFGVSTGGSGSISMRGMGGTPNNEVLVMIDGHPQYQGIFGHPLADAYVSSDVEKVEIIHGPASILYGSNAMAGVINIITKKQKTDGMSATLGTSYGSYNTQKYYGTFGFKDKKLNAFASANYSHTDGIREKTDFNIGNGYLKVGYDINEHLSVTADADLAKYIGNDNGKISAPALFGIDITRGKAAASFDNKYKNSEGSVKIFHNFGEHTLTNGFHSTDFNSGLMLYQSFRLFKGNLLTIGTDIKNYGGIINIPPIKDSLITINEIGFYAYTQQALFNKLTLSAGLRSEINSKFGNELIPMVGLTYNLNQNTTFKTSVSKGFRSPTIMEMYMNAPVPNPNLKPEKMYNYEIGWMQSLLNNKLNLEVNAYYINAKNMIQVVGGPIPTRQNTGALTNYGLEFSGKYAVLKNLFVHANYSYLHTSTPIIAAPRNQANVSVNYKYKIWNFNVSTQYVEQLYTFIHIKPTDSPTKATPNYLLLNARIAAQPLKHLEVFAMGNNLLNQQYEINDGYPMPGINVLGGIKLSF